MTEKTLDNVLDSVVSDVSPPSPVADLPQTIVSSAVPPSTIGGAGGTAPETPKKRGRPRKNPVDEKPQVKPETIERPKIAGVSPPVNPAQATIEPCAELCVMIVNTSGMILGGEHAAMNENERLLAKHGFVGYFQAKGINNPPPWVLLLGALSPYYLRVVTQTPAKSKISTGIGRFWTGIKAYFKGYKDARTHSRNDIIRENDVSEKASEQSI